MRSSLNALGRAIRACEARQCECSTKLLPEAVAAPSKAAVGRGDIAGILAVTLAHVRAFRLVSRPLLGITLRAYPAPCGRLALLLWLRHPPGYGFRLRRTLRKCRASALGAGATRSLARRVTRAGYGKFNETEIITMYQNKVTLIGFLGSDAEVRTNN